MAMMAYAVLGRSARHVSVFALRAAWMVSIR